MMQRYDKNEINNQNETWQCRQFSALRMCIKKAELGKILF